MWRQGGHRASSFSPSRISFAESAPSPAAFSAEAARLGLRSSSTLGFPTMARAPEAQGGASREQSLALALVYVLITIVYSLVGGALFLLRRPAAART